MITSNKVKINKLFIIAITLFIIAGSFAFFIWKKLGSVQTELNSKVKELNANAYFTPILVTDVLLINRKGMTYPKLYLSKLNNTFLTFSAYRVGDNLLGSNIEVMIKIMSKDCNVIKNFSSKENFTMETNFEIDSTKNPVAKAVVGLEENRPLIGLLELEAVLSNSQDGLVKPGIYTIQLFCRNRIIFEKTYDFVL